MFKVFQPFFSLMNAGGGVLWLLLFVGLVLVLLIAERKYFFKNEIDEHVNDLLEKSKKDNSHGWESLYLRQYYFSKIKVLLNKRMSLIQVITFMCPLFGLLGTVTGMIAVFDVMAHKGLGNPRLMASGVSQATLPTMVSMIIALVGLVGINFLKSKQKKIELEVSEKFEI